ncbi:MAG: hypothetical protein ACFFDI_31550, partial [Promethearchaeota archaeon]
VEQAATLRRKIKIKYSLTTEAGASLIVETEGIGVPFETLTDQILTLLDSQNYSISTTQKTLVFSSKTAVLPDQQISKPSPRISTKPPEIAPKKIVSESFERKNSPQMTDPLSLTIKKPMIQDEEVFNLTPRSSINLQTSLSSKSSSTLDSDALVFDEELSKEIVYSEGEDATDDIEADIFHPEPPQKSYSDNIQPYLKQTTSLFRRDNWEEDLPTEKEMEILERTYMRIKHRTKPEILAKDMNIPIDQAEIYLRSLISKGLLRTQVGWYIIKKSHLPFFKKTFSDGERKKKKKKSPRISRVGEGLTPEEIATIKAIKSRPNLKAQSNLLTRPTGLKQSVLKEVLRNLVEKGILRVSYGWYILKDKHILEHKRGSTVNQVRESIQYKMPKNIDLSSSEEEVIKALLQRPHYKAQSNLLTSDVKLPKDQIKQVLRDLVEKEICAVKYGWYVLKEPKQFQSS